MKESPNWLEMPQDLMANILQRLGTKGIINSARKVCTTWRIICNDPMMWKLIRMHKSFCGVRDTDYYLEMLTKQAVDRGELIDININNFGTNGLLDHIVLSSSKLNRLYLRNCNHITSSGLIRAVKRVPQLEKLYLCSISINAEDLEVIGQNCPHLKSFTLANESRQTSIANGDDALAIANNTPELRHLVLVESNITNDGLQAILSGCPHLESLNVVWCRNLNLDGVREMCRGRIKYLKSGYVSGD